MAAEAQNNSVEQAHLLYALISQEDGLIGQLLTKMEISVPNLLAETKHIIDGYPKVSGSRTSMNAVYISREAEEALNEAEAQAKQMKDEYLSVEHVMIGLLSKAERLLQQLFDTFRITKERFLDALLTVRGSARVTDRKSVV